jgi:hypothetical protein
MLDASRGFSKSQNVTILTIARVESNISHFLVDKGRMLPARITG